MSTRQTKGKFSKRNRYLKQAVRESCKRRKRYVITNESADLMVTHIDKYMEETTCFIEVLPVELLTLVSEYTDPFTFVFQFVCKGWKEVFDASVKSLSIRNERYSFEEKNLFQQQMRTISVHVHVPMEFIQWVYSTGKRLTIATMERAARTGDLELIQWARLNGCNWNEETCTRAAEGGHVNVLEWLREHGCPWNKRIFAYGAMGGHLGVLQWAQAHGCPWDVDTCAWAAWGGHLDVLKWLRVHDCPWGKNTCAWAASAGQLEALQWARSNGCPWDIDRCMLDAAYNDHMAVVEWIRSQADI